MAYILAFVGWLVGGTLLALLIGVLMKQKRITQEVAEIRPPLKELLIKAQREVDARNGIRR